ncbi:MAG: glutaredoxin family protein [Gemmataceae bacterium]
MLAWLRSWKTRPRTDLAFLLFTRTGCHLCDDAHALLEAERAKYGFAISVRNVDDDPEWVRAYGNCVPVVLINDKVRFRGKVNPVLLRRILEASEPTRPQTET